MRTARALLSALPDESMPGDVAERLHAALPREPVLTTIVPRGNRRRRWTSSPALAGLVAAAAAIALVAAIGIGSLRSSDHSSTSGADTGTAAAPLAPSTNFPVLASGLHYTDANATGFVAGSTGLARTPATLAPSGGASVAGGATARKDALTLSAHQPVAAPLQSLFGDRQAILECARLLAGGPVTPLAVDFARFTGGARHLHKAPAMSCCFRPAEPYPTPRSSSARSARATASRICTRSCRVRTARRGRLGRVVAGGSVLRRAEQQRPASTPATARRTAAAPDRLDAAG